MSLKKPSIFSELSTWNKDSLSDLGSSIDFPSKEEIAVVHPPTNEILAHIPTSDAAEFKNALPHLKKIQKTWSQTSLSHRKAIFLKFHSTLFKNREKLLDLIQLETGKARNNALEEVFETAINARYYALRAKKWLRPKRKKGAIPFFTKTQMKYVPIGLVGIISPWNYPLSIPIADAIPALLAGNAVIIKPSELTPLSVAFAIKLLTEAGLPNGLITMLNGYGQDIGPTLIQSSDYIAFTGSTRTGKIIGKMAGEQLKKCSLELGGKNPLIALKDVPAKKLAEGILSSCFSNTGQLCVSIEKVYLPKERFNELSDAIVQEVAKINVGASLNYSKEVGSLVSRSHTEKVLEHIKDAETKGAKVLYGGSQHSSLEHCKIVPTILTDVDSSMKVFDEETFGPVVSLYPYTDAEELIHKLNTSKYGLNASIWGSNNKRIYELANKLRFGTVTINEGYAATYGSIDATMGGFRESGVGRRHSEEGFYKYTEAINIAEQKLLPVGPSKYLNGLKYEKIMSFAIQFMRYIPGIK